MWHTSTTGNKLTSVNNPTESRTGSSRVVHGVSWDNDDDSSVAVPYEDETKKIAKCNLCGKILQRIQGYECINCGNFICSSCYDHKGKMCKSCSLEFEKKEYNQYLEKIRSNILDNDEYEDLDTLIEVEDKFHDKKVQLLIGNYYYKNKKFEEAFKWYKLLAEQGDSDAVPPKLNLDFFAKANKVSLPPKFDQI